MRAKLEYKNSRIVAGLTIARMRHKASTDFDFCIDYCVQFEQYERLATILKSQSRSNEQDNLAWSSYSSWSINYSSIFIANSPHVHVFIYFIPCVRHPKTLGIFRRNPSKLCPVFSFGNSSLCKEIRGAEGDLRVYEQISDLTAENYP